MAAVVGPALVVVRGAVLVRGAADEVRGGDVVRVGCCGGVVVAIPAADDEVPADCVAEVVCCGVVAVPDGDDAADVDLLGVPVLDVPALGVAALVAMVRGEAVLRDVPVTAIPVPDVPDGVEGCDATDVTERLPAWPPFGLQAASDTASSTAQHSRATGNRAGCVTGHRTVTTFDTVDGAPMP